jgi:signal transduction histidine kinase
MPADLREYLDQVLHDLLTPMATVLIWEDILRTQPHDTERRVEALAAIRRAAQQGSRLVQDLLDISRLTRGTMPLACETVAVVPLLRAVVDRAQVMATTRRCAITARLDGDAWVIGDATRLRQAFERLLDHAIEIALSDGSIAIALAFASRELVLEIKTHAAIEAESTHHVLALAVAGEMIRLHGGTLSVLDRGATFEVRLPTVTNDDPRIT